MIDGTQSIAILDYTGMMTSASVLPKNTATN